MKKDHSTQKPEELPRKILKKKSACWKINFYGPWLKWITPKNGLTRKKRIRKSTPFQALPEIC